jgi:DMSO/TMAO reductase YedYZ heme-binding membrane subunit
MNTIESSGILGLIAMVILTVNIVMGIMLSTNYKQSAYWQKLSPKIKAFKIINIHNYTAYLALFFVFLHFIIIPLDPSSKFNFKHLLLPLTAPHQPVFVLLGLISFIAILIVVITTQKVIKNKLGTTTWRNIHVISYATGLVFIVHGLVMDPLLKDRPIDFIDPEKLLVEACALLLLAAFVFRYKYKISKK